jgi:RNA polymerase sigma-70 factor (ECF subfamily)
MNLKNINKAVEALDDEYKVPFKRYFDGYKYKEIAEELDLPIGTVKSRIFLARKKLMSDLKGFEFN